MTAELLSLENSRAFPQDEIPLLTNENFYSLVNGKLQHGGRLIALQLFFFHHQPHLCALFAAPASRLLSITATKLSGKNEQLKFTSFTPHYPGAHFFEREIYENYAILPEGHPYLQPVRRALPQRAFADIDFLNPENPLLHQVGVGPVHAGVIEPGHFRFSCDGEKVLLLEIALGYQHRDWTRKFLAASSFARRKLCEIIAGDSSIAHTTAYSQINAAFTDYAASLSAIGWRETALELERLANHIGDLGALAGDTGFLPTADYCGRLRGDILNLTAKLCGNRFGRGYITASGVSFIPDDTLSENLSNCLIKIKNECTEAIELFWESPSVNERLDNVGKISAAEVHHLGMVGVAARAAGVSLDVRANYPVVSALFPNYLPVMAETGDVAARALVRWKECKKSFRAILNWLKNAPSIPQSATASPPPLSLKPEHGAVALVEGWRGEICHLAFTDTTGALADYRVIDPSFHNWQGLAQLMRGEQISNFPLCNKSFNLSYCGVDL